MTAILEASNLSKRYEDFTLSDVALSIPPGTISGIFGANGAGKTTLVKLLAHQIRPSSGTVRVFGLSYADREVEIKNRIGYAPQEPVFYWGKSVRGTARFVRPFYDRWDGGLFYKLLDGFGVPREKKVKHLSRGQKTLLCLALALSHEAELLILDEPTAGLDFIHRREILDRLREFVADGERTVIVSSHVTDGLDEFLAFGDRIGQRLLEVDILAGFGGGQGVQTVPMVRRDDQDAVDVLAGQELAEIVVAGARLQLRRLPG